MKRLLGTLLVLASLLLPACSLLEASGNGHVTSEERPLSGVSGVTLATLGDLAIQFGETESIQIEAEENLLSYIVTDVRDGMLTIETKRKVNFKPTKPIRYTLTIVSLDKIYNTSLGSISAPHLRASDFELQLSSYGNVTLDGLDTSTLAASLSSYGNLQIAGGEVETQKINIDSYGSYQAGDLRSRAARVEINSYGEATVWVTDLLDAHLTSAGSVSYYGDPRVTSETTSTGKLIPLGTK